jgi:hypothetical protein
LPKPLIAILPQFFVDFAKYISHELLLMDHELGVNTIMLECQGKQGKTYDNYVPCAGRPVGIVNIMIVMQLE